MMMPQVHSVPMSVMLVTQVDRKSTRLNSSHSQISYAVFCLKKKKQSNAHHYVRQLLRAVTLPLFLIASSPPHTSTSLPSLTLTAITYPHTVTAQGGYMRHGT